MLLRIVGALTLLLGVAATAFAVWALATTDQSTAHWAENAARRGMQFNGADWATHWRISGAIFAIMGAAAAVSGLAMALGKRRGLLLAAGVATFAAIQPWAFELLGFVRYGYEHADIVESIRAGPGNLNSPIGGLPAH